MTGRVRLPRRQDVPVPPPIPPGADCRVRNRADGTADTRVVLHDPCDASCRRAVYSANPREEVERAIAQLIVGETPAYVEVEHDDGTRVRDTDRCLDERRV